MFGRRSRGFFFVGVALGVSTETLGGAWQGGVMRSCPFNPFTATQAKSSLSLSGSSAGGTKDLSLASGAPNHVSAPHSYLSDHVLVA